MMNIRVSQRSDYTFKYNRKLGRHGWLRLTPAYSVKLVSEITDDIPKNSLILDPFSGVATTGLVVAEKGLSAHCFDINEFLIWFGSAKCRNYWESELEYLMDSILPVSEKCRRLANEDCWVPEIHKIERWWCHHTLKILAALRQAIVNEFGEPKINDTSSLVWIAFCRLIMETSSATFNHISMSFNDHVTTFEIEQVLALYQEIIDSMLISASAPLKGSASVIYSDSRDPSPGDSPRFTHIITSPPYPNRISYIRELRPYMYWTKFLTNAKEAGEIDWHAIGGTWGVATSRLHDWEATPIKLPKRLNDVVTAINESGGKNALLMANYVWKYFHDMHLHFTNIRNTLSNGAKLSYIVGNSSFYGVQVYTEQLLVESLKQLGYTDVGSRIIRKRNSKKELFEFCITASWN